MYSAKPRISYAVNDGRIELWEDFREAYVEQTNSYSSDTIYAWSTDGMISFVDR